jgi:hypothetical protein
MVAHEPDGSYPIVDQDHEDLSEEDADRLNKILPYYQP